MNWLDSARAKRLRGWAREAELAARVAWLESDLAGARSESAALREKLERLLDNVLFAAGASPLFSPDDKRFQPRPLEEQIGLSRLRQPTTAAEWRRRAEVESRAIAREEERKRWRRDLETARREVSETTEASGTE